MLKKMFAFILFLFLMQVVAQPIKATSPLPRVQYQREQTSYISPVRNPPASPAPKKKSFMQFLTGTVLPGALGSLGVVAGAIFAWWALRNKNKTFEKYLQEIKNEQSNFLLALQKQQDKTSAIRVYRQTLERIQEDAETATAVKKLDADHLTAIINKIKRILNEVENT